MHDTFAEMSTERVEIATATLGERRVATMADVAKRAGVTKMTVSYAFSGKRPVAESTRQAILMAARELNFAPNAHAQRLAAGNKGRDICLYSANLSVGVDLLKLSLIRQQLQARGYTVSVHSDNTSDGQKASLGQLRSNRPAAIVCDAGDLHKEALTELECFVEEGGVVVSYGRHLEFASDCVTFNHGHALDLAASHLLELGHRKLGLHILGPARAQEPEFVHEITAGFESAVKRYGAEAPAEWRFRGMSYENHEEGGAETALKWLKRPRQDWPTGHVMVNDSAAAAFVAALTRHGVRVPQDVAVVSTDDLPIARYFTVPLTTVTQPVHQIVDAVVQFTAERLDDYQGPARHVEIAGHLIERESSGRRREN